MLNVLLAAVGFTCFVVGTWVLVGMYFPSRRSSGDRFMLKASLGIALMFIAALIIFYFYSVLLPSENHDQMEMRQSEVQG